MALAVTSATLSLFGQLPGPLVYGYLFDISCKAFRSEDGTGDCLQYDNEMIKNYVIRFSAMITIIPLILDIVLLFCVKNIDLYIEPINEIEMKTEDKEVGGGEEEEEEDETSV